MSAGGLREQMLAAFAEEYLAAQEDVDHFAIEKIELRGGLAAVYVKEGVQGITRQLIEPKLKRIEGVSSVELRRA